MPTWVVTLDKDLLMLDTLRDILEGPDHPKLFQEPYDRCNPKFQAVESTDLGKMLVREGLPLKNLPSMRICGDMSYLLDTYAWVEYLPLGQMATTVISPDSIYRMGSAMKQTEEEDLVYKGPWVRSAQQRLFQTLENDYGFPKATCRSLVNLIWDFLNEIYSEKLHEGQITYHATSASESPGKSVKELTTVPVHLTLHDRNDLQILSTGGISGLRRQKIFRLASEARDQNGLLT